MHQIFPILGLDIEMISIPVLVWSIYIAIVLGIIGSCYNKVFLGKAIRAIIAAGAYGEEKAMTAEELGFGKNPLILHSIDSGVLARFIKKKTDGQNVTRYYMDEELRIRAELRYQGKKSDIYFGIIGIIVFLILAFVAAEYLPAFVDLLKDMVS